MKLLMISRYVGGNGGGDFDSLPFGVTWTKYFWAYY
jgi:hypothetical protein